MTKLKEIRPDDCYIAFQKRKKEYQDLMRDQNLQKEIELNILIQELIHKNKTALEQGIIPFTCSSYEKEIVQKVAKYHRDKGWSCFTYSTYNQYGSKMYYLRINFPGLISRFWRKIKTFFSLFFQKKNFFLTKTVYRG